MAAGGRHHLGEDGAVGSALVELVQSGTEVADRGGTTAGERRGRLAPRVDGEIAIDADVEVRVYSAREHQPAASIHDHVGVGRRDRVHERGDPPGADADVATEGAHVGYNHRAIENGGIVAGQNEGVRTGGRRGPASGRSWRGWLTPT